MAGKLFINRLLETNQPVPTIWIANEISHIDKAYLRRFDYSIELAIPRFKFAAASLNASPAEASTATHIP